MQVVVKKPRIRLEGEVIEDEDEELVEITKSEWYHHIRSEISPSENIAPVPRTSQYVANRTGRETREIQSAEYIEHGKRAERYKQEPWRNGFPNSSMSRLKNFS
ncbi:MAG: hypothetical protein U5P10_08390 [Spirochaetia bacterium]|nr:hypothetical protein [Spirochaetia bacterium]